MIREPKYCGNKCSKCPALDECPSVYNADNGQFSHLNAVEIFADQAISDSADPTIALVGMNVDLRIVSHLSKFLIETTIDTLLEVK